MFVPGKSSHRWSNERFMLFFSLFQVVDTFLKINHTCELQLSFEALIMNTFNDDEENFHFICEMRECRIRNTKI